MSQAAPSRTAPALGDTADALVWAVLHALAFALSTVVIKLVSVTIPALEQVFARAVIGLCILLPALRGCWREIAGPSWPLLLFRGVAGFVGVFCLFHTVGRLPLFVAMTLTLVTPVFVALFGRVTLGERVPPGKYAHMALVLAGVLLAAMPQGGWTLSTGRPVDAALVLDVAIGLLGSVATAAAFVSMRAALKTASVKVVVFYFMGCSAVLSLAFGGASFVPPSGAEWLALGALGALGVLSDMFKTRAYQRALAGLVSVLSLLSVVFAAVFGWMIFAEAPAAIQLVGIAAVLAGIALLTRPEARRAR